MILHTGWILKLSKNCTLDASSFSGTEGYVKKVALCDITLIKYCLQLFKNTKNGNIYIECPLHQSFQ